MTALCHKYVYAWILNLYGEEVPEDVLVDQSVLQQIEERNNFQ